MARKTPGIYIAIRGDYSAFETDLNRAKLVAKEQGEAIAKSIGNAVSKADLTGGINKLTRELKTAQTALSSGAFKAQVSGLDEIAKAAGVSSKQLEGLTNSMLKSQAAATANRAFEYLQKNAGLSTLQLAKLRVELGDMSGALSTLATGVKAHAVGMLAFGAAAAMAGKQVLDASLQMDRLNKAYATITGSSSAAQNQLDYMYDVTQRLGLQFQGTAEAAKGFFAAGKDSALTDHLNGIFESVSMAGSALALSKDQMDGVFLALGQMISKGKVQAEELRGQLGERLPGAFDMAAKAMGVTTAKLDDMLKKGQVTAEEMLPKLAKVLHDDFAVAAAEASQGLQGQLNRLSTEWTRFQASLLNGDAAAKVMKQLASGMKVLADHGAEIASIVGKGIQWAVWTAGVYAAIKALSGLRAAVTAAKAALVAFNVSSVAAAVGSLSGLLGPAGLAAAVGAAAVAFTSLSGSTQSTDEIFQKHQATIDAYKKRMGEAQKSVESFSEAQRKAYKESLELQSEALKNDIAEALKGMNKGLSGIGSINFGNNFFQTDSRQLGVYRAQLEGINNQLLELGKNVTRQDLDIWKSKVMACAEQVRGNGLATKEWTDFIIQLVGAGDSFYIKLAAMIDKGVSLEEALRQLERQTDATKTTLATGWALNVDDVTKGIATMEKSIRGMQAEMLGFKSSKALVDLLPGLSPEEIKEAKDAFGKNGLEGALRAVGDAANDWGVAQRLAFNDLLETGNALDDQEKKLDAWRKKHSGKASAIEQTSTKLETLRKEVAALEEANIPVAKSFDQIVAKLELERKNAVAAAEETAKLSVQRKQATATQATEQKALEIRKAELVYTQKLREAEAKRDDDLKKNADLRLDFEKRYADMVGLSSEAVSKSISKQAEEYRKAIEAGENAAEELVRLEEWKRDQIQRASREAMDGAQVALRDYQVEASNQAKSMNDAFRGLFSGMDSGWKSAWEQMIETGKVSLSSFRSAFASFLADLMHMAITRPITVQIAGVVSGMLGTGGVAYAAGGNGGSGGIGLGNFPFSSLLPDSWTSGVSSFLSYELPGTAPGISGLYGPTMGGGNLASGLSLGSALMYGGLGSLGYSLLGGALGLPQNKYSGITSGLGAGLGAWGASAALSGTALGATLGSAVPVVGTVIGAALGGLASSLFGGGRRTHASVYGKMEDVGFSRDQQTYIDAFMGGAWYDRAGKKEAEPFAQGIAQVASQTAGSLLDIAGALPEQIRQQALSGLKTSTWSAGRGVSGASWNFQWWKEGMGKERLEEAAKDMRNQMTAVAQKVFADAGISQFFDTFDVTTDEGLQKASTALSAISAVKSATDAIKSPLSEMEQQAQSAKAQLDAWTQGMKDSGVNAQYAAGLINEYRNAFINDYIKTLDESLHPLSAYEQAIKNANEAVDQRKKALEIIGATESQLAQVEAMRAEVVKQATEEMLRSFDQSVAQRWAAVNGNSDEVGRAISQANELRETIQQFGEGSAQVAELLKLHAAETAKAAQDAAKSEYDSLKSQMDALEQQRVQLQQQAIQEQINVINEQLSAAKTLKSTWEGLDKSLGQSRYNLFAGSANLDAENRLGTVQAEFRRLSGLALGGDSDAAGQLAGVGNSLLDLVKQTTGTEEEYLDAFWAVNAQLKAAQDAAGAQVSAADKQLEALQGQLDVQNAALTELQGQSATLEEIEKQIADLKPLLDAAGQKAGVKAFARGGLAMPGWAVVGEEGPELVNFSQPGRVYTAADTAALFRSATPRAADTDSGSREEVKALRREVYELRRDMLISMSEIARFSRRTSDMVEAWDAEGMPGVRA
ncbi:tape measure protein [Bilophila wadsworthia]|uniref:tape measure protein n=2 Tax=Bilophila wadsworthia TaxID=35833 RepID=UPI00242AA3E7|nr:tape measure protein [Bilophila wadsworthia]